VRSLNGAGLNGIDTSGILILVFTLATFLFFLATYRTRAILWFGTTDKDARPNSEEVERRRRISGGLYLLETLVVAAFCFLLTLSMRVAGLSGMALGVSAVVTCSLVVLVAAPLSVRGMGTKGLRRNGPSLFPRVLLRFALLLRGLSLGQVGEGQEEGRKGARIEGRYERDLFKVLSRLRDRQVSEVMIARVDMVCADECSTISELAELVKESGHTKIPIFAGTIDSITGYVTAKDVVLRLHQGGGERGVSSIARRPTFVPSDATIEHTLREMQKASVALAVISNTSRGTVGLATSQDILEEIVGDLYEDYEPEEPAYQVIDEKTAIVRGNVAAADLKEIFGVIPPAAASQTLGEYVRDSLGAEAGVGDCVSDEVFSYSIVKTTGRSIWSVKVEKRA
jgi:Mg2+/Co2+ transporter CorC